MELKSLMVQRIIPFAAVFVLFCPLKAPADNLDQPLVSSGEPQIFLKNSKKPISLEQIESAITKSSLIARLKPGQSISLFDTSFNGRVASLVFLNASSDLLVAACLEGEIHAGNAIAGPGQLLIWSPGNGEPQASDFDIGRFLATTTLLIEPDLQQTLDELSKRQERLIFWGVLERSNVNAQALKPPSTEQTRRSYLRREIIIRLRLKYPTVEELAGGVARAFVRALRERDAETVADLLNPALFVPKGSGLASGDWEQLRLAFAGRLIRQPWGERIGMAEADSSPRPDVWLVAGPVNTFAITLNTFDGMIFVNGVKPVVENLNRQKGGIES